MLVVILAAQRAGQTNPLAEAYGVSHKCLVPIGGRPLIAHVLDAACATPGVTGVRVVIEPELFAVIGRLAGVHNVECVAACPNLADSVAGGMAGISGPVVITTADNVNLSARATTAMAAALSGGADVAIAMARKNDVLDAHPEGQRRFYRFRDDHYSNCNLYALSGHDALKAAEAFRGGGQFAKSARRIIDAFGLANLLLFASGSLTLEGAMRRIGHRFGLRIVPVVLGDGRAAIDVDNERTYRIAETFVLERAA